MAEAITFTPFSASDRPTAFRLFDNDAEFQADADRVVYFVQRNMGAPVVESELDIRQIWTAFETATTEYSAEVNTHHARNILLDMLGQPTGSLSGSENAFPVGNQTQFARKQSLQYAHEFGVGSPYKYHTASIELVADKQVYDLWPVLSGVLTGNNAHKSPIIRKVHHYEPFASYRFFDTTSVMNFMGNSLNFESYTPETIFYLLPIWEDILRGTQLELNQRVRRSNYSFDLRGFDLRVYPTPNNDEKLFFEYTLDSPDPTDPNIKGHQAAGVISNVSNLSFGHITYRDINSIGRSWIWKMTLAMAKENLGQIWSKYQNIPVLPEGVTLGGPDLIQRGREDQANLRQQLREILEALSYKNLVAERNEIEEGVNKTWKNVVLPIFISK